MAHYRKRSIIESTVMMIKTKFGDYVRSKTDVAMKNEVLCKIHCDNICCLISAMFDLGIQQTFSAAQSRVRDHLPTCQLCRRHHEICGINPRLGN